MEKGLTLQQEQGLQAYIKTASQVILREQEDKIISGFIIALALSKVAKLYQVPNWSDENAQMLSDWILETYEYETLSSLLEVLKKPPAASKTWRLTPDTISEWMALQIEKEADRREREHKQLKEEERKLSFKEIPDFDKLFAGTWYEEAKNSQRYKEEKMKQVRAEFLQRKKDAEAKTRGDNGEGDLLPPAEIGTTGTGETV